MSPRPVTGNWERRLVAVAAVAFLLSSTATGAYQRPGRTQLVSVASGGGGGNGDSLVPSLSADGRFVAYMSLARNLVPDDTNNAFDIFVRDTSADSTERVSVASDGAQGAGSSEAPSISADGRFVAFVSTAPNLVPGDSNGVTDVFVHDRASGTTGRVSVASGGAQANGPSQVSVSRPPALSADGRFVAFESDASNLVPGDSNGATDVFVHDRASGTTGRVSVASGGVQANGASTKPALSADGGFVAFVSAATNLVSGDANGVADVFLHDGATGTTRIVSIASDGSQANRRSDDPTVSAGGRVVAFWSPAPNLVPADANQSGDVFVHDVSTALTERISVGYRGGEGDSDSGNPTITPDGRFVGIQTLASNLAAEPGNGSFFYDILVHDRVTGSTERASVSSEGEEADWHSYSPALTPDGRFLAFASGGRNLVPDDASSITDVFLRERGPTVGAWELVTSPVPGRLRVNGFAAFAGTVVADAADPPDDGDDGATAIGGEITRLSLTYRPEAEDLLVRLHLAGLPGVQPPATPIVLVSAAGAPGILYVMEFTLGGVPYQVRVTRAAATNPPAAPYFGLLRCPSGCTELTRLPGGYGVSGPEIRVGVPLEIVGMGDGSELTAVRARTAVGDPTAGPIEELDEVTLGSVRLPGRSISLGIAPPGTPESNVTFNASATLMSAGMFLGYLDPPGPGQHAVWARGCLGNECGSSMVLVDA